MYFARSRSEGDFYARTHLAAQHRRFVRSCSADRKRDAFKASSRFFRNYGNDLTAVKKANNNPVNATLYIGCRVEKNTSNKQTNVAFLHDLRNGNTYKCEIFLSIYFSFLVFPVVFIFFYSYRATLNAYSFIYLIFFQQMVRFLHILWLLEKCN